MGYHFKNLIFEGGGVKGIAYVGALNVLTNRGILENIKRVGGTSAGAINALLLGLGYSTSEMKEILSKLDFRKFLDDSWGFARDTKRLINEYGWYEGDFFRQWIAEKIAAKTGNGEATFGDVYAKREEKNYLEMFFLGTNLSTGFSEVFSPEHTPTMCIADAVRISMSIPLFFKAIRGSRGDVYVDGGVLNNYPVKLFDREKYVYAPENSCLPEYYKEHNEALIQAGENISSYVYNKETLGFRLDSTKEIAIVRDLAEPAHHKIHDFFTYTWRLVETIIEFQQSQHLHSDDWQRTIYVDTLGVKTTDFDLSDQKKKNLVKSGKECTEKYFAWYDNQDNAVANRP